MQNHFSLYLLYSFIAPYPEKPLLHVRSTQPLSNRNHGSVITSPYVYDILGIGEYRDTVIRDTVTVRGGGNIFRLSVIFACCVVNPTLLKTLCHLVFCWLVKLSQFHYPLEGCKNWMLCSLLFRWIHEVLPLFSFSCRIPTHLDHLNPWCGS